MYLSKLIHVLYILPIFQIKPDWSLTEIESLMGPIKWCAFLESSQRKLDLELNQRLILENQFQQIPN